MLSEMGEDFPDKKNDEVAEEGMNNFDLNKNWWICWINKLFYKWKRV